MQSAQPTASSSNVPPNADRLYVGNLASTVDEYTLVQIFSKYGRITKLDFMFHKTGVLKGKPRGFAFVQFSDKGDALKAMIKLHDRLLRGRKLVVTYASSAPLDNLPLLTKGRRSEPPKTTTLSLLKSHKKPQSTVAQIAAMEAKLAAMQKRKPADENWVPGQDMATKIDTSCESPAAVSETEETIGEDEAKRAAEDLEKEMAAALERKDESRAKNTQMPIPAEPPRRGLASLPPKPYC
ncbi:uncharacterized protein L203_106099 [Cryptococcus depauperatus CBS 7841]|uniref:Probable RNA-binding protein 18 n=1 Tax=Cryptococcus depauperatus CBS 7841 TaxID=1295531 RepID=A0A1E3IVB2_9TREE|nr:single-stranded nucleic acid binding protein [Cryptococcus depauperatus CBS 7841]